MTHLDSQQPDGHTLSPDENQNGYAFLPEQLSKDKLTWTVGEKVVDEPKDLLLLCMWWGKDGETRTMYFIWLPCACSVQEVS